MISTTSQKKLRGFTPSPVFIKKQVRGFSLVEVIVSIAIAAMIMFAITNLNLQTTKISLKNMTELKAGMYVSEGIEVGKDLELSAWDTKIKNSPCISSSPCHPSIPLGGGPWTLDPNSEPLDNNKYTRSVWIDQVYRDNPTHDCSFPNSIVTTGGNICPSAGDPSTVKFVSEVTWNDGGTTRTQRLETYLYKF